MRMPTYTASSSMRILASVFSDADWPSCGSYCLKSVTGVAACHAASSIFPSIEIGPLRRAATAVGARSCGTATSGVWAESAVAEAQRKTRAVLMGGRERVLIRQLRRHMSLSFHGAEKSTYMVLGRYASDY